MCLPRRVPTAFYLDFLSWTFTAVVAAAVVVVGKYVWKKRAQHYPHHMMIMVKVGRHRHDQIFTYGDRHVIEFLIAYIIYLE